MSDGHAHAGHAHGGAAPRRRLVIALALTASFMVAEVVAGLISGSLALLSDAGHMLTDAGALALAIWAQSLATRARSGQRTFGYRRAEILAAAANAVVLAVAAIAVVVEAVSRFRSRPAVEGMPLLLVAAGGLVVNIVSARVLAGGAQNLNTRAAAAHVLADAAGSVAAIVAGALILAFGWTLADPITSILISVLILFGSWRLLRDAANVLMEGAPADVDVAGLERTVAAVPGVVGQHDLHVWSIAGDAPVVTVHVVIARGHHGVDVARAVADSIARTIEHAHVTVQPEAPAPEDVLLPPSSLLRS